MAGTNPTIGEQPSIPPSISGVPTAITAFIDHFSSGPTNTPTAIESFLEFEQIFGGLDSSNEATYHVQQFFNCGGGSAVILNLPTRPSASLLESSLALLKVPFNLLCMPATANLPTADMRAVMLEVQEFCATEGAFYIADIPPSKVVPTPSAIESWFASAGLNTSDHAAVYYPRLSIQDPLRQDQMREIGYSGTVAGIYARIDNTRGVWHAPAGAEANLSGATPAFALTDAAGGQLNSLAINPIRLFPTIGTVLWGARTAAGAANTSSSFQYINIRRLFIYIEQSIQAGLQWAVFEPNNPVLWSSIRLTVNAFLMDLWKQGAFQGSKPDQAFFVKCDATTVTQTDIDNGTINVQVGFAPIRPAEFVLLTITLFAKPKP
jgi:phage tail sheath protein FI